LHLDPARCAGLLNIALSELFKQLSNIHCLLPNRCPRIGFFAITEDINIEQLIAVACHRKKRWRRA